MEADSVRYVIQQQLIIKAMGQVLRITQVDCLSCHTHDTGMAIPPLDLADTPHDTITVCDECHDGINDMVADATLDNAKCLWPVMTAHWLHW